MIEVINCSYADVMNDPKYFADKYYEDGVFGLRGIHASEQEQLDIILSLGDVIGWVPRTADCNPNYLRRYEEDHSHTFKDFENGQHTKDDMSVNWHLEHVFSSLNNSTVAGFWNMLRFDCDSSVGMTYFRDNSKLIEELPSETVDFMRKSQIASDIITDKRGKTTAFNVRNAIESHPFKDAEVLRVCQGDIHLVSFEGKPPTGSEKDELLHHCNIIVKEIITNLEKRRTWYWEVGDMLVSDLFTMSHAVAGGFKENERKFLGFFCSHPSVDIGYM